MNDGGPAFPTDFDMSTFKNANQGMSLRAYYAGLAMQALIPADVSGELETSELVEWSIRYADALIAAMEVKHEL